MSARSFFDIRYTIPGYTFILYFILVNLESFVFFVVKIAELESITLLGIIFGFLTLLSGAALGFLVSQPWHALNNLFFRIRPYERVNKRIKQRFSIEKMDYKVLSTKKKALIDYLMRRWDLFNLMGAIISAIGLGTLFGWLVSLTITADFKLSLPIHGEAFMIVIAIFTLIIILSLIEGMYTVAKEWVEMSIQMIAPESEIIDY
jgi:hypothetical protein